MWIIRWIKVPWGCYFVKGVCAIPKLVKYLVGVMQFEIFSIHEWIWWEYKRKCSLTTFHHCHHHQCVKQLTRIFILRVLHKKVIRNDKNIHVITQKAWLVDNISSRLYLNDDATSEMLSITHDWLSRYVHSDIFMKRNQNS